MTGLPNGTPIYLYTEPVDFRKGFDGLTGVVTASLGQNVTSGALFLFVNQKRDRIKTLWWETGELTLWYRRLKQAPSSCLSLKMTRRTSTSIRLS